ncbi:MAG TPA: branched-chain amino acid ABC transporter permease [Chloroflexota bacterium]|nr:branched-chain amino acid ABC transporter permease [Chloroflexota bacterium]
MKLLGWAVAVLVGLIALALPYILSPYYTSLFTQVFVFGLLAMSVGLLGGYLGLMPLGHAALMGVAAYGLGFFIVRAHAPMAAAIGLALLATVVVSLVFGLMAVRTTGVYFTMITLAQGMLVWGAAFKWYQVTGAENGLRGIERPAFAASYWEFYYLALFVFAACWVLLWLIVHSPLGLSLQGIRESESRMRTLGFNVTAHKLLAFLISGFFAGVSGLLFGWYNNFISPGSVGLQASADTVLMVIIGGAGSLLGPVVGAALIVFIKNILSIYVARWPTIMGLIFMAVILFAREGLVGFARNFITTRRTYAAPNLAAQLTGERGARDGGVRPAPAAGGVEHISPS